MGTFIAILIVAALIGGIVWNHKNSNAAMEGVEFSSPGAPGAVAAAISAIYCGGAKAKARTLVGGVTVRALANSAFHYESKIGDVGRIEIRPGQGSGSVVRASSTELYIGSHPKGHFKSGFLAVGARLGHGIYKLLGIAPNAARMKRFQNGLEGRVAKQLSKAVT